MEAVVVAAFTFQAALAVQVDLVAVGQVNKMDL